MHVQFFFTTVHAASNRVNLLVPHFTVGKRDVNSHHYCEPHSRHYWDRNAPNSAELWNPEPRFWGESLLCTKKVGGEEEVHSSHSCYQQCGCRVRLGCSNLSCIVLLASANFWDQTVAILCIFSPHGVVIFTKLTSLIPRPSCTSHFQ